MERIKLNQAKLLGAHLSGAKINKGKLTQVDLSNADLYRANFSGSNLSGSSFLGVYPYSTDFTGVVFSEETKTDSCLDTDFLSRLLNKILREFRQYDSVFTKPLESLIVQICRP